jgi:hypothetical protein
MLKELFGYVSSCAIRLSSAFRNTTGLPLMARQCLCKSLGKCQSATKENLVVSIQGTIIILFFERNHVRSGKGGMRSDSAEFNAINSARGKQHQSEKNEMDLKDPDLTNLKIRVSF